MNIQSPSVEFSRSRRELISALRKLRRGDFSVRLPSDWTGLAGKIADVAERTRTSAAA